MVWLKIRRHDILAVLLNPVVLVVVWLKIRRHDIIRGNDGSVTKVVVWLKIRRHDIYTFNLRLTNPCCGLIKD